MSSQPPQGPQPPHDSQPSYGQPPSPQGQPPYGQPQYQPQYPPYQGQQPQQYPAHPQFQQLGQFQQPPHQAPHQPHGKPKRFPHPVAQLGGFTWWDLVAAIAYYLLLFIGLGALILFIPGVAPLFNGNEALANVVVLLFTYAVVAVFAMIALGNELWKSFKTFRWYPWAKYLCIPGLWLGTVLVNIMIQLAWAGISGETPTQSQNQQMAEGLASAVPWWLIGLAIVPLGPLVEEFFFRHLMIGKLSRWVNQWVLMVVSSVLFMFLHFVDAGEMPTVSTGAPYLVMGLVFGTAYILSGKSIAYSWILHMFNNGVALALMYTLQSNGVPEVNPSTLLMGWLMHA